MRSAAGTRRRMGQCCHRRGAGKIYICDSTVGGRGSILRELFTVWNGVLHGAAGKENFRFSSNPSLTTDTPGGRTQSFGAGDKGVVAVVDSALCVGCGSCVDACPVGAVYLDDKAGIYSGRCTGCGACVETCFRNAISLRAG